MRQTSSLSSVSLVSLAILGAVTLGLVACGRDLSHLEPVSHPDVSSVEESARSQIDEARAKLEKAMKNRDDAVVAAGFGAMGRLYHAYGLHDAAAPFYRNAAAMEPKSFAWAYDAGLLARDTGDLSAAEAAFLKALELRPKDDAVRVHLGETLLLQGRADEARPHFEALDADSDFAAARAHGLARVLAAQGDDAGAVDLFQKVLELQPQAGGVRTTLAQSLRRLGRTDEAQAEVERQESGVVTFPDPRHERLLDLPQSAGSLLRRGNQALLAGDTVRAVELFRRGKNANPDNLELRLNLALALVRHDKLDDAMIEIKEVLEKDPSNAQAHHDLGATYRAKGLGKEAIAAFKKAVELNPDYTSAHFNLANAYGGANLWAKSEASARRVVELEPDHARARYLAAMAQHQQGNSEPAEAELRRLVEAEPDQRIFREGLAAILATTRRVDEAVSVIAAGADGDLPTQEKVALLDAGAKMIWAQRRPKEAVSLWRRAVELAPDSSTALTSLANGLQLLNERTEAAELFAKAVELEPKNTTAWLSGGNLLILEGKHKEAKQHLQAATELHPSHPGLANALARLLATSFDDEVRDGDLAVMMARQAYGAQPSLDHAETVSMALAEMGRFEAAVKFQNNLVRQAQATGQRAHMQRLVRHLRLYENRRPVRIEAP